MTKIYEQFPEITNIRANVLSRKFVNNNTYLILDKTIFMPKNDFLIADEGFISGHKILDVEEKKDNIVHLIEGKEVRKEVILDLDKEIRNHNLAYATSFSLFKIFYQTYYSCEKISLSLEDKHGRIIVENPTSDFNEKMIEELIKYSIDKGLRLTKDKGIVELKAIGKTINNLISYDNTYKIKSFFIEDSYFENKNKHIIFKAGK